MGQTTTNQPKNVENIWEMPDNPFDMRDSNIKSHVYINTPASQSITSVMDDEIFVSFLKKEKLVEPKVKINIKPDICNKIKIIAPQELKFETKRYYKFPFNSNVKNDGSDTFKMIYNAYLTALSAVYSNFKRFKEPFKIFINNEIIFFGPSIKAGIGLDYLFKHGDINFIADNEILVVDEGDVSMVYDMLLNLDVPKGKCIPLILSEFEFENAMVYHTRMERGPIVRTGEKTEYLYTIFGPLYTQEFIEDKSIEVIYE